MNADVLGWLIHFLVALLLVASGLLSLLGGIGLWRLPEFFQRMHPTALAGTLGSACVVTASIAYFSLAQGRPVVHAVLISAMLAITLPVTTILLARAALFRQRSAGRDVPTPLNGHR